MSIDWSKAPEGATHCLIKDSGTAWFRFKDDLSFPNTWKDGEWKNVRLPTRELTPKPKQPKQLTQAVFDGLPPEYRWAAVSRHRGGSAHVFPAEPSSRVEFGDWTFFSDRRSICVGSDYDATDWQNSLIERLSDTCIDDMGIANAQKQSERQDVPTAADIDWAKADIDWSTAPEGATHYSKRFGEYYKAEDGFLLNYLADESRWIVLIDWSISALESPHFEMIKRTESITDVARSIEEARQVEATLAERQNQYGDFKDVAHLSQGLQSLLSVGNFSDTQQEAMQMICSKLARLACGDADHVDSWHDIAGYATLVVKDLESGK